MFSNMPITLSRFSSGVNVNDQQTQVSQGYVDNTSLSAGSALGLPLGGTQPVPPAFGGNNYTSTVRATTAAAAASRRRRTPTWSRRCASSRRTSTPRSDTAWACKSR